MPKMESPENKSDDLIFKDYFNYHKQYKKKYGNKILVLMQVGGFYEAYSTDNPELNHGNLSEMLNINLTKKNKKFPVNEKSNPYMMGFPLLALPKFLDLLKNFGYTTIVIDQVGNIEGSTKKERKITEVVSNGTSLENKNSDANNIVCIYIEDLQQKDGKFSFCIGLSVLDISTGISTVHETYSKNMDDKYSLDEATLFINHFNPKEIVIYRKIYGDKTKAISQQKLLNYLEINDRPTHYYDELPDKIDKISYQKEFLKKLFPDSMMLDILEYLDIDTIQYARLSYLLILEFAFSHNEDIVKFLYKPKIYSNIEHLVLGNGAIYQLNVSENKLNESLNGKFNSLLAVINKTSTAIGKRFLTEALNFPLVNQKNISKRYDDIELMIKSNIIKNIDESLKNIIDIERFQRKMFLGRLHPYQFSSLIQSYNEIIVLINTMKKNKYLKKIIPDNQLVTDLQKLIVEVNNSVDIEKMSKYNLGSIEESFFKLTTNKELDDIQNQMNINFDFINKITDALTPLIPKGTKSNPETIKMQRNDRDGYYLVLTKKRSDVLHDVLKKKKEIIIGKIKIDSSDFSFRNYPAGNNVKLYSKQLSERSNNLVSLRDNIMKLANKEYLKFLSNLHKKYIHVYQQLSNFIGYIDFIKCGALCALEYNYCKPTIVDNVKNGFVNVKELRHPIVERINDEVEYITNDLSIGKDNNQSDNNALEGMLIYGLNSAGKSTIMKALGLSVIMAQAGFYVPARQFTYHPYKSIYARITGNDNILKGLSSFALEMIEVRAILARANPYTLVIGDEVCRGTEYVSGNALVASTILKLAKSHSSFIFATHLHEIPELKEIKELKNVKSYHIEVKYDDDTDNLIFERKLKEGSGPRIYGITVAKYLIHDSDFISKAEEIKREILKQSSHILNNKTSRYNNNLYIDSCAKCGKEMRKEDYFDTGLETHHINHQAECENGFVKNKPHMKMNSKSNLVVICKECHHKVHHEGLDIKGYKETAKGKKLDIGTISVSDSEDENDIETKVKLLMENKNSYKDIHKKIKKEDSSITLSKIKKIMRNIEKKQIN